MFGLATKTHVAMHEARLLGATHQAAKRVHSKFGAYVRKAARNRFKPVGKRVQAKIKELRQQERATFNPREKMRLQGEIRSLQRENTSRPGQSPRSILGFVKQGILFDATSEGVVIGPAKQNRRQLATRTLEKGGVAIVGSKAFRILPRPFMGPAFRDSLPHLGEMWKDAIK